jgi:tetratricopeptide (TPR) repeat protein
MKKERWHRALENFQNALRIHKKLKDKRKVLEVIERLGDVYFSIGEVDQSLECYNSVYESDTKNFGIYKKIAKLYMEKGDLKSCLEIYKKLISEGYQLPRIYFEMGLVCDKTGLLDLATQYYQECLEYVDDDKGRIAAVFGIGRVYEEKTEYTKAIEYYENGLKIAERTSDLIGIAKSCEYLGKLHKGMLRLDVGTHYLEKSVQIYKKLGMYEDVIRMKQLLS